MPHMLQGIKLSHRRPWGDDRSVRAHIAWAFKRLSLRERLEDNRWLGKPPSFAERKRVFGGQFS